MTPLVRNLTGMLPLALLSLVSSASSAPPAQPGPSSTPILTGTTQATWLLWVPAVAAFFTMLAAAGALWNASNSRKAVLANKRIASANLLLSVVRDYAAPEFGNAMARLRQWKDAIGETFVTEYVRRVNARDPTAADLPGERRRVASLFNAIRALCERNVLEREMVARTLGEAGFRFFVEVVDPLDRAHNVEVMRHTYNSTNRDFCQALLDEFFPKA